MQGFVKCFKTLIIVINKSIIHSKVRDVGFMTFSLPLVAMHGMHVCTGLWPFHTFVYSFCSILSTQLRSFETNVIVMYANSVIAKFHFFSLP